MRKLIFVFLSGIFFAGCDLALSTSHDLESGATITGNGLICNNILTEINGKSEKRKIFEYGEKLEIIFSDFEGFNVKEGKVYPLLSALILKNEKDTALYSENLLDEFKEGTDLNPLQLNAFFLLAFPYQQNEKYELKIVIRDAIGDGVFTYTQPLVIQKNDLLSVSAEGYTYSNIYLWDMTTELSVFEKNVSMKDQYALMLEGLQDPRRFGETIYPVISVEIKDALGMPILSNDNLLVVYENTGVLYEDVFMEKLPVTLSFNEGSVNNPCSLHLSLYEPGTPRKLEVKGELILE
jgi:hypothetical protein